MQPLRPTSICATVVLVFSLSLIPPLQADDVLKKNIITRVASNDPANAITIGSVNYFVDLFEGLMTYDRDGQVTFGQAESHEVTKDGLVHTYRLREGLKWSDGVSLTTADFVTGIQRILGVHPLESDLELPPRPTFLLDFIRNASEVSRGELPLSALGVRALDDRHIEFTLIGPIPFFNDLVLQSAFYPTPTHLLEKHGAAWSEPGHIATNGAYILDTISENGEISLVRNPFYRDADNVRFPKVSMMNVETDGEAASLLGTGQMDITPLLDSAEVAEWLSERAIVDVVHSAFGYSRFLIPNQRDELLIDPRLRRALNLAIDRDRIAIHLESSNLRPAHTIAPTSKAENRQSLTPPRDLALDFDTRQSKARELLADAGYGPDRPLTVTLTYNENKYNERLTNGLVSMLRAVNINLIPEPLKRHEYNRRVYRENDFQLTLSGFAAYFDSPYLFYVIFRSGKRPWNLIWNEVPYDQLLDDLLLSRGKNQRRILYDRAEELLYEKTAVIPLLHQNYSIVHRSDLSPGTLNYSRLVYSRHIRPN